MNIDLRKRIDQGKAVVATLVKKSSLGDQKAKVVVVLDISASMRDLYNNGYVQTVLERITPLAMQFDDDGEFELYLFQNDVKKGPNVNLNNLEGFVKREILGNSKYPFGGTQYAPAINRLVKDYGNGSSNTSAPAVQKEKSGFFGSLFGKKKETTVDLTKKTDPKVSPMDLPTFVIFITDGDNSDPTETTKAIIEASFHPIFIQTCGIGNTFFNYLRKLNDLIGRFLDNVGFFNEKDFTTVSDESLYGQILNEFPDYIVQAKANNLIK